MEDRETGLGRKGESSRGGMDLGKTLSFRGLGVTLVSPSQCDRFPLVLLGFWTHLLEIMASVLHTLVSSHSLETMNRKQHLVQTRMEVFHWGCLVFKSRDSVFAVRVHSAEFKLVCQCWGKNMEPKAAFHLYKKLMLTHCCFNGF